MWLSLCEQGYHYTNGGQMPRHNRTEQPVGSNGQSPLVVGALPLYGRNVLQALPLYSRSMLRTQPLKSRSMLQAKPLKSRSMLRTQPLNDHILPFNGHQQFRDRLRHVQPELGLHGIVLGVYQRLCYCCRHKTPSELLPDTEERRTPPLPRFLRESIQIVTTNLPGPRSLHRRTEEIARQGVKAALPM